MEFIKNLNKEYTLLIVSHRQNALKFCDRIIDIKEKIDNNNFFATGLLKSKNF